MNHSPTSEKELLEKINLDISVSDWNIYKHLVNLRRQERLSEKEHEHLISLGEKIEVANAQRIKHLLELAQLRNVSIEKLMKDLNIKPVKV